MGGIVVFWSKRWLLLEKWVGNSGYFDYRTKSSSWIVSSATSVFKVTGQCKRSWGVLTLHTSSDAARNYSCYVPYLNIMGIYFINDHYH